MAWNMNWAIAPESCTVYCSRPRMKCKSELSQGHLFRYRLLVRSVLLPKTWRVRSMQLTRACPTALQPLRAIPGDVLSRDLTAVRRWNPFHKQFIEITNVHTFLLLLSTGTSSSICHARVSTIRCLPPRPQPTKRSDVAYAYAVATQIGTRTNKIEKLLLTGPRWWSPSSPMRGQKRKPRCAQLCISRSRSENNRIEIAESATAKSYAVVCSSFLIFLLWILPFVGAQFTPQHDAHLHSGIKISCDMVAEERLLIS